MYVDNFNLLSDEGWAVFERHIAKFRPSTGRPISAGRRHRRSSRRILDEPDSRTSGKSKMGCGSLPSATSQRRAHPQMRQPFDPLPLRLERAAEIVELLSIGRAVPMLRAAVHWRPGAALETSDPHGWPEQLMNTSGHDEGRDALRLDGWRPRQRNVEFLDCAAARLDADKHKADDAKQVPGGKVVEGWHQRL